MRRPPPGLTLFPQPTLSRCALSELVVTAPAGITWTLPLYELALLAAAERDRLGLATRVTVVTPERDRKSTRLNSSHANISYAVFCLKKKVSIPLRVRVYPSE